MSCWDDPEMCRGCPYCIGPDDITPEAAHRIELEDYAGKGLRPVDVDPSANYRNYYDLRGRAS